MSVLLGIYLRHDANIAASIDGKIKYRKMERFSGSKHASATIDFVYETLDHWGIKKVDYCAYCSASITSSICKDTCPPGSLSYKGDMGSIFPNNFCVDHHYAHVLSAWPVVDTEKVEYGICVDGKGDKNKSASIIKSPANNPELIKVETFPSLGFEFSEVGNLFNFSGLEYDLAGKLMGLQAYSEDEVKKYTGKSFREVNYKELKSYKEGADYHTLSEWHEHWWRYLENLFKFDNDAVISYSGGCAQNTVYNYRLKRKFKNLNIPPHCYDGGLSLGCLEFLRLKLGESKFNTENFPFWQDDAVGERVGIETIKRAAELLARGKIIGWMQGRGELGPRALGNRSILMGADVASNKDVINKKVKKREPWRPFAGTVLKEKALEYFDMGDSPYMLYASNVNNDYIPAVTHVDGTCRMQTVDKGPFYELIYEYEKLTGIPVILNTSMNLMGKPIVSYREDAYKLLDTTDIDAVIVGNGIERKCKRFL